MFSKSTNPVHPSRYTLVAITLHWVMAALIGVMIWLGWNMDDHEGRFQLHKSIGITLLFLTLTRIGWRLANPPPPPDENMDHRERLASEVVHFCFYALMLLLPLAGWLLVSISKFQVPTVLYGIVSWPHLPFTHGLRGSELYGVIEFLHGKGAWLLIALLGLHVAGAVKHQISARRGHADAAVLPRMAPGLFGNTAGPHWETRGTLRAFGLPIALFLTVAMMPFAAAAFRRANTPAPVIAAEITTANTPAATLKANWDVNYQASQIRFSGVHDGNAFSGIFEKWNAQVAFFPEDLPRSVVIATIDTGSARTGKKLYDDSLQIEEWFDVSVFPQAMVRLTGFSKTPGGYLCDATIVIKGQATTVPLRFTLTETDGIATLQGEALLNRKTLKLGQMSDPSADWVKDEVKVTLSGQATRIGAVPASGLRLPDEPAVRRIKLSPPAAPAAAPVAAAAENDAAASALLPPTQPAPSAAPSPRLDLDAYTRSQIEKAATDPAPPPQ
jgi:cytochrome b561/polyisoprenoid-binding protein YceI